MAANPQSDLPQLVDTMLQRTAIGLLLLAAASAVSAADAWLGESAPAMLPILRTVLSLGIVVLVLPSFIRFLIGRRNSGGDSGECDSYLSTVFSHACVAAFTTGFLLTIALEATADRWFGELPTGFFLNIILAVTLCALSASFFYQLHRDSGAH